MTPPLPAVPDPGAHGQEEVSSSIAAIAPGDLLRWPGYEIALVGEAEPPGTERPEAALG